jgi:hypothetical protein
MRVIQKEQTKKQRTPKIGRHKFPKDANDKGHLKLK